MNELLSFYKDKRVFISGHTGFKGAWLCEVLKMAGAIVVGYALEPQKGGIFDTLSTDTNMKSYIADIRDSKQLSHLFIESKPEIVIHMAAQPLVLDSYERPAYTFETNVMGTVNLLECVRESESALSVVVVTTDKVYKNNEWFYGYRETDTLGGSDPYSASKACSEFVADSYRGSFLNDIPVSTVRAGNVIGGGDVSVNRIVPDCVRAALQRKKIIIRNPFSIRPYQHVLDPLFAYLQIAKYQFENNALAGSYNIGPDELGCISTQALVELFCAAWGEELVWNCASSDSMINDAKHEATFLKLDCSKARSILTWKPIWSIEKAVAQTVKWEKAKDKTNETYNQINEYIRAHG